MTRVEARHHIDGREQLRRTSKITKTPAINPQHLIAVMNGGGFLSLDEIVYAVAVRSGISAQHITECFRSSVRMTLEEFCTQSKRYAGNYDLFRIDDRNFWICKIASAELRQDSDDG